MTRDELTEFTNSLVLEDPSIQFDYQYMGKWDPSGWTEYNVWCLDLIEDSPVKEALLERLVVLEENGTCTPRNILNLFRDSSIFGGTGVESIKAFNKRVQKL